jgi:excisionase family DNA binding protein
MNPQTRKLLSKPAITVDEFAQLMGLSRNGAYSAVANGHVKAIRIGRRVIRIPTGQLRTMLGLKESPRADRAA